MEAITHRTIKLRRDTAVRWVRVNPVLAEGEPGHETDTGRFKIGDGNSVYTDLPYFTPGDGSGSPSDPGDIESLFAHINSSLPHPVYDDGPSLSLLYENAKV